MTEELASKDAYQTGRCFFVMVAYLARLALGEVNTIAMSACHSHSRACIPLPLLTLMSGRPLEVLFCP